MIVGVPKETKDNEFRVSVIPATVEEMVRRGHRVLVEPDAELEYPWEKSRIERLPTRSVIPICRPAKC